MYHKIVFEAHIILPKSWKHDVFVFQSMSFVLEIIEKLIGFKHFVYSFHGLFPIKR